MSETTDIPVARPKILFIHRSLGGQFEFFGGWLAQNGWEVTFASSQDVPGDRWNGARVIRFDARPPGYPSNDFRYPVDFAAVNALGTGKLFYRMRYTENYIPDIVIAHVGWGVGLSVKQIWPEAIYIAYHEWYYTNRNWDKAGEAERPVTLDMMVGDRMRNLPISAEFDCADAHWCPTRFQASRFPPPLRSMLQVVSDGVDCAFYRPDPDAKIDFDWLSLPKGAHILTYATRGMEPIRGFPQFLKAVKKLQTRRSDFHTVILANETVSYGHQLGTGESWRLKMLDQLDIDQSKLHVFGMKSREEYLKILQASSAHVYFSEPFVTSWSLSEALAAGCLVIGSATAPVQELIVDEENGFLVDMDDSEDVADMINWCFDHPDETLTIRENARAHMLKIYDRQIVFREKERIICNMISD